MCIGKRAHRHETDSGQAINYEDHCARVHMLCIALLHKRMGDLIRCCCRICCRCGFSHHSHNLSLYPSLSVFCLIHNSVCHLLYPLTRSVRLLWNDHTSLILHKLMASVYESKLDEGFQLNIYIYFFLLLKSMDELTRHTCTSNMNIWSCALRHVQKSNSIFFFCGWIEKKWSIFNEKQMCKLGCWPGFRSEQKNKFDCG